MFTAEFFFFFCPDGITPNSGLTGPNNTYIHNDFYTIRNVPIVVHDLLMRMPTSLSVDEILLPR